jgi:hypothetical protein
MTEKAARNDMKDGFRVKPGMTKKMVRNDKTKSRHSDETCHGEHKSRNQNPESKAGFRVKPGMTKKNGSE